MNQYRRLRCEAVRTVVDERLERRLFDRAAPPGVDTDVDHATAPAPPFVDVAVEEPRTLIDWPLLDEPVVIVAVASIREVARQDPAVADIDVGLTLMDLGKACGKVPLSPALGSSPVAGPASVVVTGEQQLAPVQASDDSAGSAWRSSSVPRRASSCSSRISGCSPSGSGVR